jgi:hypothetical protein
MSHELLDHASTPALMAAADERFIVNHQPEHTHVENSAETKHHTQPNILPADHSKSNQRRPHAAHGDRGDPDNDDEHARLLNAGQVKRRYGNASDMWLWRRLHDSSGFPPPLFICGRRFWKLSTLLAWERARAKGEA